MEVLILVVLQQDSPQSSSARQEAFNHIQKLINIHSRKLIEKNLVVNQVKGFFEVYK